MTKNTIATPNNHTYILHSYSKKKPFYVFVFSKVGITKATAELVPVLYCEFVGGLSLNKVVGVGLHSPLHQFILPNAAMETLCLPWFVWEGVLLLQLACSRSKERREGRGKRERGEGR